MSRYFIHSILVLTLLIPIHANYSPKNPPPTSTSQRPSPSTDSFITTLSRMHRAYVSWQGDTTPSHHLADHMPSMHGTSTQAPPTMTKSALLAYKPTKHQHDTITYNIMDNTHDVPELFRDTHGYGATLMRAMSFPTHFLSDLDAESMVECMPFFTSSSTDTSTPTSDMTSSPSLSFHPLAIPTTSTKPYRSETLAFMTPSTLIVSGPDTSTLSIPILCYNCTSHHLSYMIRIYNITAIPGIDYVDVGTVTSIVMGNITYINITQGNDTISQSITTSNFTFPLIFNPYFRLSYLTPRKLTLKLFNITNLDTGVSNLPYGADMNTSSTDIYHTEIYHDIHILPAFPRVGFNYVDHNLTDLMTETTVQIDCQYCQGLDITVRLSTESVDSQAGIDFDETTATLIWLSRNGTIPNMTWTNTTIIPTRPPNDNGTIVPGSGQGGDDPAINNPDNGTDSSNTTYPNGTIPVTPVSPVEPYAPHVVVINLNDMDYKYGGIISQNITIPLHPRRSIRNQRHFHVRLFSGTATLAGLNLTSNSSYTPDGRLIWNNITLPVNFSIPLTIDPDQAEMIIMTTPYCGAGDLHYANRTVYVCNTTRYLPSEWKKQTSLNFNGTHLAGTNATCSNVISYFNLTSNNATHIAAIYQLCSPYLNGTNTTDNSNTTHNNSTISSIGGVRRLLQDTSSSSSSSSTGVDSGSSSIGNISSTGDGSFTGSSSNSSSGGSSSSDSGPSSSDLPSPTDPDLPRMCSLFAQCQYTNSCSPVAESTPVCYCPYNHYGPVCQYNTKIACTIGAVEPVMNTTTCKETNARLNNIYDIELEGSPPCYIMGKNRTYLSYYLDCRFDDTHQHIRQGPDEIELVRLTEGEYIWDKNTTLTNYSVMRLDPKTGEMLLAIREFVQPLLRVRIINFYRLSDISEQGASTVDLASLEDPYNVNNSISFWFRHADLSSSFTFAGRVYLEAHLVRTDKFPGPQVFPYHTMHLEIPDWKPPPYQPPSRLSSGAIAAIVIVVILIVLGALLAYYRYRLIRKKQEEAAKKNALRVPLLGEQMGMSTSIESSPPQSRIHQSSSSSAIPYQAVRSPASS